LVGKNIVSHKFCNTVEVDHFDGKSFDDFIENQSTSRNLFHVTTHNLQYIPCIPNRSFSVIVMFHCAIIYKLHIERAARVRRFIDFPSRVQNSGGEILNVGYLRGN